MDKKQQKKKKSSVLSYLFLFVGFLVGLGILLYPTISDQWNRYRNQRLISTYSNVVEEMKEEDFSRVWAEAREYNAQHKVNVIRTAYNEETEEYILSHPYDQILNPMGNEIMGYIEIPKIDVKLAIYHGTGPEALENGCGHVEGTSLPIGGAGCHSVLSAHRGLPSAALFTDLDQMKEGDLFLIQVLDETLAYRVDQILTVKPEETEALAIEEEEDLVTLVTCTPYGVNSHRLLVRGRRTEYVPEEAAGEANRKIIRNPLEKSNRTQTLLVGGLVIFIIFLLILNLILDARARRRKKKQRREEMHEEE
ncbi:MAG: class C sortase [Eubacteriales bacterium]|nr:class C sortase [Eubacteriales bacterium]